MLGSVLRISNFGIRSFKKQRQRGRQAREQRTQNAERKQTLVTQMAEKLAPEKRHSFVHNGKSLSFRGFCFSFGFAVTEISVRIEILRSEGV